MLFGVRVTEGSSSFRKSVSMNNLCQYDRPQSQDSNNADAGYASDDVVHPSDRCRGRKRGEFFYFLFLFFLGFDFDFICLFF